MTTREAKLDQLRSMGVVEAYEGLAGIIYEPTYIGRCLWFIEKSCINRLKLFEDINLDDPTYVNSYVYRACEKLFELRHDKDKPLSEQSNKEEICDLLIGLSI